jgi:hypothetical protein
VPLSSRDLRRSERILLTVPIAVMGFDSEGKEFTEQSHTVVLNEAGARIALQHGLVPETTIRILNLETFVEAEFRVVGAIRGEGNLVEWGVECIHAGLHFWDLEFPPADMADRDQYCALLECSSCRRRYFWPLTEMEAEVLESTQRIQYFCKVCGWLTFWSFADPSLRRKFSRAVPAVTLPSPEQASERRESRRVVLRLPVRVRNVRGEEETSHTENASASGFAAWFAITLSLGETVAATCPYYANRINDERKALVRRAATPSPSGYQLFGFEYLK